MLQPLSSKLAMPSLPQGIFLQQHLRTIWVSASGVTTRMPTFARQLLQLKSDSGQGTETLHGTKLASLGSKEELPNVRTRRVCTNGAMCLCL